jgi:hypothetical protein
MEYLSDFEVGLYTILGGLAAFVICGWIGSYIAKQKGRSTEEGFLLGGFLLAIGWIIEALLPEKIRNSAPVAAHNPATTLGLTNMGTPAPTHRKCPFCAEQVLVEAKICRFCQRDLPELPAEPPRPRSKDPIFRSSSLR